MKSSVTSEGIVWKPSIRVEKYSDEQLEYVRRETGLRLPEGAAMSRFCMPEDVIEVDGPEFTVYTLNPLIAVLIGGPSGEFDSTRIRLGVGEIPAFRNYERIGEEFSCFRRMDATFPYQLNGFSRFKATYGEHDANFHWKRWSLDVNTLIMKPDESAELYHGEVDLGVKDGGLWVFAANFAWIPHTTPQLAYAQ